MLKDMSVDLAIVGAGTSGISAFKEASKVSKKIVLIDQGPLGTTCARIGCMPSKAFIQAANYFHERHLLSERGITGADRLKIDIPQMMQYVRKMRDDFTSGIMRYLNSLSDQFIQGNAEICDTNSIKVNKQKIIAKNILIATGAHSFLPDSWLNFSNQILTSENFFEQHNFEDKIVVIGAGLIGLELGQALSRSGIDVTTLHSHETIGKLTDPEVNQVAINIMQQEYHLLTNQKAEVRKKNQSFIVENNQIKIETNQILAALGRRPNLINIDFKKMGIETNQFGVPYFDETTMQIQNSNLFIAGDVTQERQLLHEAADEGRIAGYNAIRSSHCFQRRTPLNIIFTDPNIAIVGQTYKDLLKKEFIIGEVRFDNQGRSRIMSKNKGILRVYAEPEQGVLLGAEMIAPGGEHLAHMLAWGIQQKMTASEILQLPYYHPIIEEGMRTALRELAKQVKQSKPLEMVMCDSEATPILS